MAILDEIQSLAVNQYLEMKEKKGILELSGVIAERKAFLTKQKLEYRAKFRLDDAEKILKFTEMLLESKSGLSTGDTTPGFGFKAETYSLKGKQREGTIEEQSDLFGKKYEYRFDFKKIRSAIENIATKNGYQFKYQITPVGL
jgi:hypothetical protein